MKKLISVLLILCLCLSFAGCSANLGKVQEGAFEGDGFSLTVPSGWHRNDDQKGALAFLPDGYNDYHHSYISVSWTSENRLDTIELYEETLQKELASQYESTLGENATYTIGNFERSELDGKECYYVLSYFVKDELAYKQEQYTFDTSFGSVTISYVLADGEDFASAFEASKKSIVLK